MRKPKQKVITFIIDSDVDDKVELFAKRKKMFKSAVLEEAIKTYIEKASFDKISLNKTEVK